MMVRRSLKFVENLHSDGKGSILWTTMFFVLLYIRVALQEINCYWSRRLCVCPWVGIANSMITECHELHYSVPIWIVKT